MYKTLFALSDLEPPYQNKDVIKSDPQRGLNANLKEKVPEHDINIWRYNMGLTRNLLKCPNIFCLSPLNFLSRSKGTTWVWQETHINALLFGSDNW